MPDTDAARSRRQFPAPGPRTVAGGEEEPPEEVVRAAREAVRQPADPRLERSFGHLAAGEAAGPARPERHGPSEQARADALLEAVRGWQASAERASQRLETVTWVLVALTVVVAALTIVLVVRG